MNAGQSDATRRMIDAFVPDDRERDGWHYALQQIRGMRGCPCTTTTHIAPVIRCAAWAMIPMEREGFVPGLPVRNCGLCHGVGADAPGWADYPPPRAEAC